MKLPERLKREIIIDPNVMYDLEGTVDSVIVYLERLKEDNKEFTELVLNLHYGYDEYNDKMQLIGYRLETDKEYEARCEILRKEQEKRKAEKKEKKDREYKEFLRLKEKFEKTQAA